LGLARNTLFSRSTLLAAKSYLDIHSAGTSLAAGAATDGALVERRPIAQIAVGGAMEFAAATVLKERGAVRGTVFGIGDDFTSPGIGAEAT